MNNRFDALESRVAALEAPPSHVNSRASGKSMSAELTSLSVQDMLVSRKDDLKNCSRRNNVILRGFPEEAHEDAKALLSKVSQFFSEKLKMNCPRIERGHRLGRRQIDPSRPVIMKLLDFRAKIEVHKNCLKLKLGNAST